MSTTLYKEAIAEAQQLKELAEQNAKNKIIEALTPRIQAMVEAQLLSEQSEIEIEDLDLDDDGLDMSAIEVPSLGTVLADELIDDDESDDDSDVEASVIINAQGDVNVAVQEAVRNNIKNIKEVIKNSTSSNGNRLANRIAKLQGKVRRMDALLESIDASALSSQQRAVIKQSYRKLLGEALTLRSEVIIISEGGAPRLRLQLFNTLKEMNNMTKSRSRAIFNQLFEAGYGELDEMELVLSDEDLEALGVEDAEDADVDALDLEVLMGDSSDEAEEEEEEEDVEGLEVEEEEGGEEAELDLGELDEVFEIDPRVLRKELRRLRTIREQAEEEADQFGGGSVELEVMEVDEEDLLNALADELGTVDSVESAPAATTGPVAEMRRRRSARRNNNTRPQRRTNEARRSRNTRPARATNTVRENRELKKQLSEMNLFNAKLLYVNKLIQNRNVSSKQQRAIVEALDNAKTIREAKLVFEGLTKSLNKKSLSEGKRRVLGSASKPTRSGTATVNESTQTDRWATLAGIKSK
jgi:hypothetical protein